MWTDTERTSVCVCVWGARGGRAVCRLSRAEIAWSPFNLRRRERSRRIVAAPMEAAAGSCDAPATQLFLDASAAETDMSLFSTLLDDDAARYAERKLALGPLRPVGMNVLRLKATDAGAAYSRKLKCLRPVRPLEELQRQHSFDRELLSLKLRKGRACQHELCRANSCGLHVRDGVVTPEEAAAITAHGQHILDTEGDTRSYARVDFMRSAVNGSIAGHVLSLRVAERVRRIAAEAFDLPLSRVGVAETLLALRRVTTGASPSPPPGLPGSSGHTATATAASMAERGSGRWAEEAQLHWQGEESAYHCDESLAPHFHFSTVLWLSAHGDAFTGGEISFLNNRSWAWLVVEPRVGRAAIFSSGWENIHGIKPVERGERWALSVPLMVNDELATLPPQAEDERGRRFRDACVRPADKQAYQQCRASWAAELSGKAPT